ncbi:ADP-ribosyltransferse [Mycobacteroides abscessus subsp. bolletii]|uniref:alpha/beta hydrolase n=1 Tax=Mycobacteroides abscessus TaxID=36809 RepID=UPI000928578C|nr:alpha/beta hydrolase [Mycobacteroides abscessus]SHQ49147.1 ADP-ribosyltransferse [Mycobacteroides abscessus subsp. bolletii]SHR50721.1 ADP-ribosyltransferse [Mycobacteroides abscessus subsp. bolletii]SHS33869.1 ADP-ribosyltransferse [Mycobacteroides abscessus subsp. bolletii]SHT01869.1 ADP-ribosyltransferse [Mycobacteroides abscessus subsp. bolletii]SHX99305.1 ADP-ribosyltransferse [Mycobacteroides abscessus subsp. bolletii]
MTRFRVDPAAMADMAEAVAALRTLIGESVEQGRDGQHQMAAAWDGASATSADEVTGKWVSGTGELGEMVGKIVDYLHGAREGYVRAMTGNADMWSAGRGSQLDVDPPQLAESGKAVDAATDALLAAVQALSSAPLSFDAGQDDAGKSFGEQYGTRANQIAGALVATLAAARSVGHGIGVSAANYALADAAATIPQAAPSVSMPAKNHDPKVTISIGPANGGGVLAPALWSVVEFFVGDVWPNGDPDGARAVAPAWRALWQALSRVAAQIQTAKAGISAQTMPEAQAINKAIDNITKSLTQLAQLSGKLASDLEGFADEVQHAQDSVRDLLRRLSPSNMLDTLGDFLFHGESPVEEIKAVARDIKGVLDNHGQQVEARKSDLLGIGAQIDAAKDAIKDWVSKEFPSAAPVINALVSMDAGALKNITGMFTGPLAYVAGLDPTRFVYDTHGAQQAWGGLAKTVGSALDPVGTTTREIAKLVSDPGGQTDKTLETVKALVDWEAVEKGDPWEAVGYNLTTAATFLVPGGGAARAASLGTDGARVAEGVINAETKTTTALGREAAAINPVAEVGAQTSKITETLGKLPEGINPGELKLGPSTDPHPPTVTISEPKPGALEHPAVPAAETKPTIAQPVSEGSGVPVQAEHHGPPALERPEPRPGDDAALLGHNGAPAYSEAPGHGVPALADRPAAMGERATEPALAGPAEHTPAASSAHPTPPDRPGPGPSETTTPQFTEHTPSPADHLPGERPTAPGEHSTPPGERPLAPGERPHEPVPAERTPAHPAETPRPAEGPVPPERAPTPHNALPEHGEPVPARTPASGEHTPPATAPTGPAAPAGPAGPAAPAHPTSPTTPHAPSTPAAHGEPVKSSTITPLREPIREPVVPNRPLHEPPAPAESKPSLAKTTPGEATPVAARAHEPAPAERSPAGVRPGPERPAEPAPAGGRGHDGSEPPKPPADSGALLGAHGERPEWVQKVLDGQLERPVDPARLREMWDHLGPAERTGVFRQDPMLGEKARLPVKVCDEYARDALSHWRELMPENKAYRSIEEAIQNHPDMPRRYLLGFEPTDGRSITSIGNPDLAAHTGVLVPGTFTDATKLIPSAKDTGYMEVAQRLQIEAEDALAREGNAATSVVDWQNYLAPQSIIPGAARKSFAETGAPLLRDFLDRLDHTNQIPDARRIVIGHSYGAVVVGEAAQGAGLNAHSLVTLGGAGMHARTVEELILQGVPLQPGSAPVWALIHPNDPIRILELTDRTPLGHGRMTHEPDFGAHHERIAERTGPWPLKYLPYSKKAHTHAYWQPESDSLEIIGEIIAGIRR